MRLFLKRNFLQIAYFVKDQEISQKKGGNMLTPHPTLIEQIESLRA